jgi:hypothetical protein
MPGMFFILAEFKNAGLFLYGLLLFRGYTSVKKYFFIMLIFVGAFSFASLMKQEIIQFYLMIFFAFILSKKRSLVATLVCVLFIVISFPQMAKLTSTLRNVIWSSTDNQKFIFNSEQLINKYIEKSNEQDNIGRQYTWIRINYTSQQAFAVDQYDKGVPGNSFATAAWAFVPRIIYPEKPIITFGENFTRLAKGGENISGGTGPGAFSEGYWNKGWAGVIFVGLILGFLLVASAYINNLIILTNSFQYFPLSIIILKFGYRIDDWFVATAINSIPMLIFSFIVIKFIEKASRYKLI